jgi:hypothetical protein
MLQQVLALKRPSLLSGTHIRPNLSGLIAFTAEAQQAQKCDVNCSFTCMRALNARVVDCSPALSENVKGLVLSMISRRNIIRMDMYIMAK